MDLLLFLPLAFAIPMFIAHIVTSTDAYKHHRALRRIRHDAELKRARELAAIEDEL